VEYGDSLASISRKYHTTPQSIAEANNLTGEEVKVGSKLIIPVTPGKSNLEGATYSSHATHYRVRKGDTLDSVADDFEVPADKLKKWNHLRGSALVPGRVLLIYKPTGSAGAEAASSSHAGTSAKAKAGHKSGTSAASKGSTNAKSAEYHKVKKGETLSSIAESYNTSVAVLKRDNPKLAANLRAGDVLVIHK
jgi:LysM repeat protein